MAKFQIVESGVPIVDGPRFDAFSLAAQWLEQNSVKLPAGVYAVALIVEEE